MKLREIFHPRYTFRAFWWLWRAAFVICCMVQPRIPGDVWLWFFGLFLVVEAWGVLRQGKHDTLSETHWSVGKHGWAFRVWSVGWAAAYSWQYYQLPMLVWGIEPSVAHGLIALGLFGWLSPHFFYLGKHG